MKAGSVLAPALLFIFLKFEASGTNVCGVLHRYSDVSGTWDLKVETPGGTATPSMVLAQEGERITGTYRGRLGESKVEGTIRGNQISFSVALRFRDEIVTIVYRGTVDGDSMKGTAQFGDRGSGNWTAKRRQQ